ncbi:Chitin elicitor receptor kinase 1 [Morella rubra]|uniref:non-specific serine/threonine protein kinase n=1 Tax=Morella rubra TaxID=262757 RepID=A0A6A1UM34_9ROSI|nr:Chitin elicitor receptor kinase 1 [Morella rubra]
MISLPKLKLPLTLLAFHYLLLLLPKAQAKSRAGCPLAIASYYVWQGSDLHHISNIFSQQIPEILKYNPNITNMNYIRFGSRINVPFSCDCLNGDFLGHTFSYVTQFGDTYDSIAQTTFSNLTTEVWVQRVNAYAPTRIPDYVPINVTVNCSCGDRHVSKDYGLFATYPLRPGEDLSSVAAEAGVPAQLLEKYNPGSNFSAGSGLVFVPVRDENGKYPPLKRKKAVKASFLPAAPEDQCVQQKEGNPSGSGSALEKASESVALVGVGSLGLEGSAVDKSVKFSYEELAEATNDFSIATKIGQGGFGSVYYAELRGEKAAIKKMDMQASEEFLAELKVLTHVHHLNLVRLIGYCVEGSLCLVYEYIENGNLSEHLRGSGREPLSWSTRVQIALDSSRGLEYIHEHTVPVYIHRDIKSANILIDKNFRAKVADFGLTKLTKYGKFSLPTGLVGTFGYMPPEYAYGDVTSKVDVYAFGVVLYELISARGAILKTNEYGPEATRLVTLVVNIDVMQFEDILSRPDPDVDLPGLVDPRLEDNYPLHSVCKMAHLAKACTQVKPQLRPSMRSVVVALMTLTEDWDVSSFYENQAPLMSPRLVVPLFNRMMDFVIEVVTLSKRVECNVRVHALNEIKYEYLLEVITDVEKIFNIISLLISLDLRSYYGSIYCVLVLRPSHLVMIFLGQRFQ